jgi:hypothetical protein
MSREEPTGPGRRSASDALTQCAQDPRVFYRDDRLRRKILQQRDLIVGMDILRLRWRRARRPSGRRIRRTGRMGQQSGTENSMPP